MVRGSLHGRYWSALTSERLLPDLEVAAAEQLLDDLRASSCWRTKFRELWGYAQRPIGEF